MIKIYNLIITFVLFTTLILSLTTASEVVYKVCNYSTNDKIRVWVSTFEKGRQTKPFDISKNGCETWTRDNGKGNVLHIKMKTKNGQDYHDSFIVQQKTDMDVHESNILFHVGSRHYNVPIGPYKSFETFRWNSNNSPYCLGSNFKQ